MRPELRQFLLRQAVRKYRERVEHLYGLREVLAHQLGNARAARDAADQENLVHGLAARLGGGIDEGLAHLRLQRQELGPQDLLERRAELAVALGAGRRGETMLEKQLLRRLFGEVQRRLHAGKQALFGEFDGPVQHQAPPPHDREVAARRAEVDEEDIAHVAPGALAGPGHYPREGRRSDIERRDRQPGAGKQLEVGDDVLPGGGSHHRLFRGIVGIRPSHGHEIDHHPVRISVQAFPDFPGDGLRVRLSFGGGVVDAEDLELVVRHARDHVLAAERMLRPDALHRLFQPARLSQHFVPGASDVHGGSGAEGETRGGLAHLRQVQPLAAEMQPDAMVSAERQPGQEGAEHLPQRIPHATSSPRADSTTRPRPPALAAYKDLSASRYASLSGIGASVGTRAIPMLTLGIAGRSGKPSSRSPNLSSARSRRDFAASSFMTRTNSSPPIRTTYSSASSVSVSAFTRRCSTRSPQAWP